MTKNATNLESALIEVEKRRILAVDQRDILKPNGIAEMTDESIIVSTSSLASL